MKHPCTLIIVVIATLLLSNIRLRSQTLYTFPQPGFIQTEVYHQDWTQAWAPRNNSFMYLTDTTVGPYTFARLAWIPVGSSNPWYTYSDSGKVYWHGTNPQWNSPTAGILLYDFSVGVGDTFNFNAGSMTVFGPYVVDSVGTRTMLNAQVRKYIRLNNGTDTVEWIDAIGDIEHGFFYASDFEGGYEEFICSQDSTGDVYGSPNSSFYCDANDPIPNSGPNTCDQFSFNAQIYGTSCMGCDGSINITNLTGGTPGYTYSWSNGGTAPWVTGLCQGPITLTITDNAGISCSRTFVVNENLVGVTITHYNFDLCDGVDTVCATATGGSAPYTYMWSPIGWVGPCVPVSFNGTYTVVVYDANGCSATQTITVNNPPLLQVTEQLTAPSCSTCCDGNVNLNVSGGTPAYTYMWTPTYPGTGNFCPGTYTYCVTDANGCAVCDTVAVLGPMGIPENVSGAFTVSPNPAIDMIQINRTTNEPSVAVICDVSGKIIGEYVMSSESLSIDVAAFAEGMYFVSIDGVTKRIIIARE